jgi:hypothetical protein
MPETFRNEYLREGAGANGGIARNGISTPRVCQGKIPRNPAPIGHLHAGEDDCWRNQAIALKTPTERLWERAGSAPF